MDPLYWYSCRVRLVVFAEDKATRFADSVFVYRSAGWESALARAIELGRSRESEYVNSEGENVRWALKEVLTIDQLGDGVFDGAEVFAEFLDLPPREELRIGELRPERSKPSQAGV